MPLLTVVACAAGPALAVGDFLRAARAAGWSVQVALTPLTATWVDIDDLAEATDHPVQTTFRRPGDPRAPQGDAVAVVPATFNTVNKWAAGINDNQAMGILHEGLGLGLPMVVAPCAKDLLTSHPAYAESVRRLSARGPIFLPVNAIAPDEGGPCVWDPVLDALPPA